MKVKGSYWLLATLFIHREEGIYPFLAGCSIVRLSRRTYATCPACAPGNCGRDTASRNCPGGQRVLWRIDDREAMQIEAGVENDFFSRHLAIILDETVVTRIIPDGLMFSSKLAVPPRSATAASMTATLVIRFN